MNGNAWSFIAAFAVFCTAAEALAADPVGAAAEQAPAGPGIVIENDAQVAKPGPGPHNGGGETVGYVYFEQVPGLAFSFRKRVLHAGASIGYHQQAEDEVYYVLSGSGSGSGRMTLDGREVEVKPGDAILTRTGHSHGLVQTGKEDLTLMIAFEKKPAEAKKR